MLASQSHLTLESDCSLITLPIPFFKRKKMKPSHGRFSANEKHCHKTCDYSYFVNKMADSKIKTCALTILSFSSLQPLEIPKSDYDP